MTRSGRKLPLLFAGLALAVCLALPGCGWWKQLQGENFNDEFATSAEKLRPAGPPGDLFMLSTRGQQVEKDLGYR